MPKKVAITGGTPTWRRGMAAILSDASLASIELADLDDWVPGRGGAAVMVATADTDSLAALTLFAEEHPTIPVVAVLPTLTIGGFAEAVRAGATTAVAESDSTEGFGAAIDAALEGTSLVPAVILRAMAARVPVPPDPTAWVDEAETGWLRSLAEGATVADLAREVGYSEREMFRTLRATYIRIGATNRTEAIIWATRHGLLDG